MTNPSWHDYARVCPICGSTMQEDFDIDANQEGMVCEENQCLEFRLIFVSDLDSLHLVIKLNESDIHNEARVLDKLKHCSKCEGPLGSAGNTVVCDGLGCGVYSFRTLDDKRYLEMRGSRYIVKE